MPVLDSGRNRQRFRLMRRSARLFACGALAISLLVASGGAGRAESPAESAYDRRCVQCHGPAAGFAAGELVLREQVLVGRHNGVPVAELLTRHGRTRADEIAPLVAWLKSLVGTAVPPPKS